MMLKNTLDVKCFLEELIHLPTGKETAKYLSSNGSEEKIDLVVKEVSSPAAAPTSQPINLNETASIRYFAATNQIGNNGSVLVQIATKSELISTVRFQKEIERLNPGCSVTTLFFDKDHGVLISTRPEPHVSVRLEGLSGTLYPLLANDSSSVLAKVAFGTMSSIDKTKFWKTSEEFVYSNEQTDEVQALKFEIATNLFTNETISSVSNDFVNLLKSSLMDGLSVGPLCLTHGSLTTDFLVAAVLRPQPKKIDLEALRGEDYPPEAAPPPAVGDLRIVGGNKSFFGPIGFDLGTLVAHLLIALSGARAKVRVEEKKVAKGGYAKYSSERARDRWVVHSTALVEVIVDLFSGFSTRMLSLWDEQRGIIQTPPVSSCCSDGTDKREHQHVIQKDDGFWKHQLSILGEILQSSIGFSACELAHRFSSTLDTQSLSPLMKEESEWVIKLLSKVLIESGMDISSRITRKAIASEAREKAVDIFVNLYGEAIVALFAVIDKSKGANKSNQEAMDEISTVMSSLLD